MSNSKEPAFTIVDKRGVQAEEVEKPIIIEDQTTEFTKKRRWKNVAYAIVMMKGPGGQTFIAGRAVGLRLDGDKPFVADYIFPPQWPRDLNWVHEVDKRLKTFLGCDCDENGPCAVHKMYLQQWQQADMQRLQMVASQPMPEALEVLFRVEQARSKQEAPRIIIPR